MIFNDSSIYIYIYSEHLWFVSAYEITNIWKFTLRISFINIFPDTLASESPCPEFVGPGLVDGHGCSDASSETLVTLPSTIGESFIWYGLSCWNGDFCRLHMHPTLRLSFNGVPPSGDEASTALRLLLQSQRTFLQGMAARWFDLGEVVVEPSQKTSELGPQEWRPRNCRNTRTHHDSPQVGTILGVGKHQDQDGRYLMNLWERCWTNTQITFTQTLHKIGIVITCYHPMDPTDHILKPHQLLGQHTSPTSHLGQGHPGSLCSFFFGAPPPCDTRTA